MKIVVTYEATDISRLIRQDLARQGITATDADIKYSKGNAVVSVEVSADDVPVQEEVSVAPVVQTPPPAPVRTTAPPALEAIEGGANPVDMSAVLAASNKVASTTEGKFPMPKHHQLLDGESFDWPGDK